MSADPRPFAELRESGLLWLINRVVFHPRGYALHLTVRDGEAVGWKLVGDGSEVWHFNGDEDQHFDQVRRTFGDAMHPADVADAVVPPRKRRVVTHALAKDIAKVYRRAVDSGDPPTLAVAEHFNVAHRTATRWVGRARDLGELGPAIGTKPGEGEQ